MCMTTEIKKNHNSTYMHERLTNASLSFSFHVVQANCEDQDQTPQNGAPDQDLHCLLTKLSIKSCSEMINTSQQPCK